MFLTAFHFASMSGVSAWQINYVDGCDLSKIHSKTGLLWKDKSVVSIDFLKALQLFYTSKRINFKGQCDLYWRQSWSYERWTLALKYLLTKKSY